MHERRLIRDAVVAALKGKTLAGDRVFKRRSKPFRATELPAVNVYFTEETIKEGSNRSAPRRLERDLMINVDYFTGQLDEEALDDEFDGEALKAEQVMDDPATLSALSSVLIRDCMLSSTEAGTTMSGNMPLGVVHLEYVITYRTGIRSPAPTDQFDELQLTAQIGTQEHTNLVTGINQEDP